GYEFNDRKWMLFRIAQGFWTEFGQIPTEVTRQGREIRSVGLQAATRSTHALRSIEIKRCVPKLAGDLTVAAQQFAIDDDADAQAVGDGNVSEIMRAAVAALEPQLG